MIVFLSLFTQLQTLRVNGPYYNDVYSVVRCPAGMETGGPMNDMCVNCSVGFYKEIESEAPCTKCRDDYTTATEGTTDPALCNIRKYCSFIPSFIRSSVHSFFPSFIHSFIAGSLESGYSLNWGAREIWGKGGGVTLALL